MKNRDLGRQGLSVSSIGLGCMGMSDFYGSEDERTAQESESVATLHRSIALGMTFLDTADMYGPYINEKLLGKAIAGRRDDVVIATKFGNERNEDGSWKGINGRPEYVRAACEGSLQRLGLDHIDLYYQHRVDRNVPIEDTVGAMSQLVQEGKVRYLGLSEAAPQTVRRAHAVHPITALQTEYSLWSREPEVELLPTVRELGIGFVAYSPLGRGFLTGEITNLDDLAEDDWRRSMPRFEAEHFKRNLELVPKIKKIAAERGVTPGQLSLAWVMAQGTDIVPIPGTRRVRHLEENAQAATVELSAADLARVNDAAPLGSASGDRYPDMSHVDA